MSPIKTPKVESALLTKFATREEWEAEGVRLFGENKRIWKFICPSCNHIASVQDWLDAGGEKGVAFSCVGRYQKVVADNTFKNAGGPCNYAGGGLFRLNPVEVTFENGDTEKYFQFAPDTAVEN